MPLASPSILQAHAVLQLPDPLPQDPARDEIFVAAVRDQFPNLVSRQILPAGMPAQAPHLTLASTSSQLAVSAAQADFEVRFYGDFVTDLEKALVYVEQKLLAIRSGYAAMGVVPAMVGLIGTLHFSFADAEQSPIEHLLSAHLREHVAADDVQDATARLALKVRDTYFVHMTVSNYESRFIERPLIPGSAIRIRPWEGRVDDVGVELILDINNNLEARTRRQDPEVTEEGVMAVVRLLREVAQSTGPRFVESGEVSMADLVGSSQA